MVDNPYQTPLDASPITGEDSDPPYPESLSAIVRSVFLAWEKLRVLYNGILIALVLGWAWMIVPSELGMGHFWFSAIAAGFMANLCFFIGPTVETYVTWLGARPVLLRGALFVLGTGFSCVVTAVALGEYMLSIFPD